MALVSLKSSIVSPELSRKLSSLHLNLGGQNHISRNLKFRGPVCLFQNVTAFRLQIDAYSYICTGSKAVTCSIGSYCCIAHNVEIGMGRHLFHHPSVSQSLFRNNCFMNYSGNIPDNDPDMAALGGETNEVKIGNDVWIGADVKFPNDVTVGHGAVIGTNTVITKDVPPYAVVVGGGYHSSQRIVKYRFSDEIISDLLDLKWWEYDVPRMVAAGLNIPRTKVEDFISFLKNEERENLIRLSEPWRLVCLPDGNTAYIFPTEPDTFMDFNYVEVDDNGHALSAMCLV
ncbi:MULTISPECIES: CatB-related O-acetyltransferase [unclassified Anaerobiospirillum]|uniref:CatB-related O-acetyltransferase n=1 Tax=unclassified Anaerobiospirillum TaxID=2647410 RepID=UPI001FF17144|nr:MULTISPECIES: CatB-related O-acetyltransferase [unclassified Anaerobiospirillum]MCK0535960.1 CatB-related O-acetyltransferase [Anaerobiospirillum sp. NML120511]MCK0541154.1 CatB-related O-acetyltransferase [Anaerobiospirillum sp. NML02-A-032]